MENIALIRILPNSKSTFLTESDFKVFVEKTMIDRGDYYYFPNAMINCVKSYHGLAKT